MRQRLLRVMAGVAVVLLVAGFGGALRGPRAASAAPAGFVYRCGTRFCLDGKTFYFAGANTYDLFTYGGSYGDIETQWMDKARIDAQFARLQQDKVSVLRLWMFSHESWHGFEPQKGVYSNEQFSLFDYVIQSAKAHNVRLIPVLENYWTAYGGIDTRLQWEGLSGGDTNRWKFFNKTQCPGCFTQYKNYVNYALNRVNHYSGVAYKNEPAIVAWELMNEPRYQNATPNENSSGTTLRAWVDEMGAYIKGIDPNHMLGTGLEGHESRYGFGGDEGNPFVYIHQSPYVDFTSAHPYPTEGWANLSIAQTQTLIRAWISDSHNIVGKPFFMGEFNTHANLGNRSQWWSAIFGEMETSGGDGDAFWWYDDRIPSYDSNFGVWQGQPELSVFRQHSANMAAQNGPPAPTNTPTATRTPTNTPTSGPSPTPTRTPTPTSTPTPTNTPVPGSAALKAQYRDGENPPATGDNHIKPHLNLVNTGTSAVALSDVKIRYWYTIDTNQSQVYDCDYATLGCANITATFVTLATPRTGADRYLEVGFTAGAGSLAPGAQTGEIQNRVHKSDWSNFTETNDYSFDGTKLSFADWNKVTVYYKGALVWGVEP